MHVCALTMYFYIQCSAISLSVFIVDDKIISSTVAPVHSKERDGCVCFCYIRCHSSLEPFTDCYGFLTKPVYHKWYSLCNEFGLTKSTTSNVVRPLQSNTVTFHNTHWTRRRWYYGWFLSFWKAKNSQYMKITCWRSIFHFSAPCLSYYKLSMKVKTNLLRVQNELRKTAQKYGARKKTWHFPFAWSAKQRR